MILGGLPASDPIEPRLGAFDTAMVVVSLVIGIGIFRTPALVAGPARGELAVLGLWAVGGLVSLIGALIFAEIGARRPRAGGYYRVIAECYDSRLAFMLNWGQALMQGAGAAGVAFLGAEYLAGAAGTAAREVVAAIAFTTMIGLCGLNFLGIRAGARAQNVLSLAKIALILVIVAVALAAAPAADRGQGGPVPLAGLASGAVAVFYAYGGYANTINLGGDVREARRNLPRGIAAGMLIVTAVYVLANWAYLRVLGVEGVASSELVAAATARAALGPWGEVFVSVAIFVSAAGFLNASILQMPRGYYAMAEDGVLPPAFMRVEPRTQVLRVGLVFFAATMLVPALALGSFGELLTYVMFTDTLSLAVVASTLFVLRRRDGAGEGFHVPGYPVTPIVYIAVVLALAGWLLATETRLALAGLGTLALGAALFTAARRWRADRG